MLDKRTVSIIQGYPISPGLAEGIIHVHRNILGPIDAPVDIAQHNVGRKFSRFDVATAKISDELATLATRVEKEVDSRLARVFGAHQLIAEDSSLREELRREILDNLVTVSNAVKTVFFALGETIPIDEIEDIQRQRRRHAGCFNPPVQCSYGDHGSPIGQDPPWRCARFLAFTAV